MTAENQAENYTIVHDLVAGEEAQHLSEHEVTKGRIDKVFRDWFEDGCRNRQYWFQDIDGKSLFYEFRKDVFGAYRADDAEGKFLIRALKMADKSRLSDSPDTPRHLYRAPELAEADPSKPVHVVEGPYKAEWLRSWGLLATTNVMGSSHWGKTHPDSLRLLQGRDVVVIADPDDAGKKWAGAVLDSLKDSAKSVRVVHTSKKVILHTQAEMEALIGQAPVVATSDKSPVSMRAYTGALEQQDTAPVDWDKVEWTKKKYVPKGKAEQPVGEVEDAEKGTESAASAATVLQDLQHPKPNDEKGLEKSAAMLQTCSNTRVCFPLGVFPEGIKAFVTEVADCHGVHPDLVATAVLVTAGAMMGAKTSIHTKRGWKKQLPNLYGALIGPSGSGKSGVLHSVLDPVYKYDMELRETYQSKLAEYLSLANEGDDEGGADAGEKTGPPPVEEMVVVDDFTGESLVPILMDNPNGVLVAKDELNSWINAMDVYKNGKGATRQQFLSYHTNGFVKVNRGGSSVKLKQTLRVNRPFVSVLGCMVPTGLVEFARNPEEKQDGLLARLLPCLPPLPPGVETRSAFYGEVSEDAEKYWDLTLRLLRCVKGDVVLGPDARKEFDAGFCKNVKELTPMSEGIIKSAFSKMGLHASRIALILQGLHSPEALPNTLPAQYMEDAWKVCEYFKAEIKTLHGGHDHAAVVKVLDIAEKLKVPFQVRQVQPRLPEPYRSSAQLTRQLLTDMVQMEHLVLKEKEPQKFARA